MHIAKNDIVEVTSGNDRGKRGKVLKVFPPIVEKLRAMSPVYKKTLRR